MPVVWNWRDPKTVELSNQGPAAQERAAMQAFMESDRYDASDRAFERAQASPAERRAYKAQIRSFLKNWKSSDPTEFDPIQGIEELMTSGAAWYEEDGFGTSVPVSMSKKDKEAFVWAADAWADQVGLWKNGQFDPTAPQRYREQQAQMLQAEGLP